MGLNARQYSPTVVDKIVSANAEHKSAGKAAKMLWKLGDIKIGPSQIMEVSGEVGQELAAQLQQQAQDHAAGTLQPEHPEVPRVVAVAADGGRIMTRTEAGRGVHEQAWKETKNACLLTMSSEPSAEDPHPELPTCFTKRDYVEKLVREIHASTAAKPVEDENSQIPRDSAGENNSCESSSNAKMKSSSNVKKKPVSAKSLKKWLPQQKVRTCISSMVSSDDFGPLVAGEAQRRGFFQAPRQAFLGDGQAWNWTLHKTYFPTFVPIADFVHPLGYVYDAAKVLMPDDPWSVYLRGTTACWQGRVDEFIQELKDWEAAHPTPPDTKLPDDDPRDVIRTVRTYLGNNRERMDYPTYRRQGLPTSTFMIESLIKEINFRVKGTEKFWNRPAGAEHILQIRAASLCDDDRLSVWILNRPGSLYHRTSTPQSPLATAG